jgi:hypothetical protein
MKNIIYKTKPKGKDAFISYVPKRALKESVNEEKKG